MITRLFTRTALHEHAEPSQRIAGIAQLAPEASELAPLLAGDPVADVRAAAAARCSDLAALAAAWTVEQDPVVRTAIAGSLAAVLAATTDADAAAALLARADLPDALRADVARKTADPERRRIAVAAVGDDDLLTEIALTADHAETRMAAAERVSRPENLKRLAGVAKSKDRGVARLARHRIDALEDRRSQTSEADAILEQLEALAQRPGAILTPMLELNRRWQLLDMSSDPARLARCEAARQVLQARFEREHEEQRARARLGDKLRDWMARLAPPVASDELAALREQFAALRAEAEACGDAWSAPLLEQAADRLRGWELDVQAHAGAEALLLEAEHLAAGTAIDAGDLSERWQALGPAVRTPALTQRFDAALAAVEQRRLVLIDAEQHEANAARQQLHRLLHDGEQALLAGQLHAARTAADAIRVLKAAAGTLPKPTIQRLSRLVQQLGDLERWESFGQQQARVQLCERAETAARDVHDPAQVAREIKKLRDEWKVLDQQHANVPKALWERFDGACERAYAPAARHFAEMAAQRKAARAQRDGFIAAAAAHVPTLLTDPPNWRAIEHWLRDTDKAWRDGDLGSVDPGAWKALDAKLRAAVAPLRDALAAARAEAKAGRQALIAEAVALAPRAMERDAPSQVKAIQLRWQEHAKTLPLAQRDERTLWEEFRAACNAVFEAREAKRREDDGRRHEGRRALEDLCLKLEQLAQSADDEAAVRRALRDLVQEWRKSAGSAPLPHAIESRFRNARTAVESALAKRSQEREASVWQTLVAKGRLCEEAESRLRAEGVDDAAAAAALGERWAALPPLPGAWEKRMQARRDAALRAFADGDARDAARQRIDAGTQARRDDLLLLETALALESPPELQAQRLALQVRQLKERFSGGATMAPETLNDRVLAWFATPGVTDEGDWKRCTEVLAALAKRR
ncbi:MAG: DUF349 domain-containing protein [Betaproteobacteria bacterium]|nr:DUF349 domain-containing protein [Betaproteobacteria bacterium]